MASLDESMRATDDETEWSDSEFSEDEDQDLASVPTYESMLYKTQVKGNYGLYGKGATADDTNIARPCDPKLIDAIMGDLDILYEVSIKESLDFGPIPRLFRWCFTKVMAESERLLTNSDLISDPNVREIFAQYVHNFCVAMLPDPSFPKIPDVVAFTNDAAKKKSRKTFDKKRVPWHQFLHQYAPGSNCRPDNKKRECVSVIGTRQVIPPGGLRLLRGWEQDIRDAEREIYPNQPSQTARGIALPAASKERAIGGRSRYRVIATIPNGPVPHEERILPHFQTLETLSRDLARWDVTHEDAALNANGQTPYMFVAECNEEQWKRWKEVGNGAAGDSNAG